MEPLVRQPRALAELTDDVDLTTYPPEVGDFLNFIGSGVWQVGTTLSTSHGGTGVDAVTLGWGDNKIIRYNPYSAVFDESLITIDDSGNLLTTGTITIGGADAADVPITGKAHPSQSGNFLNLTDSAGDIAFRVNNRGVPAPRVVALVCTTAGTNYEGYLYVDQMPMALQVGIAQISSGSVIGFVLSFRVTALTTAQETTTWTVYKREWGGNETELFHVDIVVPNATPAWTKYTGKVTHNRGVHAFGADTQLSVKVTKTGGGNCQITSGIATIYVLLDDGTELTTIS